MRNLGDRIARGSNSRPIAWILLATALVMLIVYALVRMLQWNDDGNDAIAIIVTDYGVVADDQGAASANVAAMRRLVSPAVDGGSSSYEGTILFPGGKIYYFDDVIPFRDYIHIDLQGSTLHFSKIGDEKDRSSGFLFAIRNFSIENGSIAVDYDNIAAVVQAGAALRLGTRAGGRSFYFQDIYDSELPSPMGNLVLKNIDITSNHHGPHSYGILMLGGLDHVVLENVSIDGQGGLSAGILYEFGFATKPSDPNSTPKPGPPQSSHAHDMRLTNIKVTNLSPTPVEGHNSVALHLGGAYDTVVDGLVVDGAGVGFSATHGEAAYYSTWRNTPEVPVITVRNLTLRNIYADGLTLVGASPFVGGYLADYVTDPSSEDQTDHLDYVVVDFNIQGAENVIGTGLYTSARRVEISRGTIAGFKWGIMSNNDCTQIYIDNVSVLDSLKEGIVLAHDSGVWEPPRHKTGHIRNSVIAGSGTPDAHSQAILLNHVSGFLLEGNTFGYNEDPTQGVAVWLVRDAQHVVVHDNTVVSTNNNSAYVSRSSSKNNILQNNHGLAGTVGEWVEATNIYPTLVTDLTGQSVTMNSVITLTAEFSGNITRYLWLKDGEVIPDEHSNSLTLTITDRGDYGSYQIVASNGALATASSVVEVEFLESER